MEEIVEIVEEKTLIKPEFKSEIKAEIKSLGQIEDNIQEVQEWALNLAKYYENVVFTEENLKDATNEKAEVNKFKNKVADFRKSIVKEYNKPIKKFEETAKLTESILSDVYNSINLQVKSYQDEEKAKKEEEVKVYFDELITKKKINFLNFWQVNLNVTLSASMKSLKEEVKAFVDKVVEELKTINTQQYADEVLVEYQKTLDLNKSIQDVANRHYVLEQNRLAEIEAEKKASEISDEVMLERIENLTAPKVEVKEVICEAKFTVRHTEQKIKELKEFLDNGGYEYE